MLSEEMGSEQVTKAIRLKICLRNEMLNKLYHK